MQDRSPDNDPPVQGPDTATPREAEHGSALMQDGQTVARSAEVLLREHPEALVCGLAGNGLIVPVPQSVGLWGQNVIEGRALIDNVVAEDRSTVVRTWIAAQQDGAATAKVRMQNRPASWARLHFIDLREVHGVLIGVVIPSDEEASSSAPAPEPTPAAPRFCTLTEDEGAKVLAADEAFTQMFGFTEEELLGKSVLDQIHPDDQGRAIEGWLAVLATRRAQQTRLRRRRKDGGWMWVDTTLHNYLADPERKCVMVELIDISAEMQAQEALHEHEELLRRLTDAMPVGLLQLDTQREIVYHNARLLEILYGSAPVDTPDALEVPTHEPSSGPATPAATLLKTLMPESLASFEEVLDDVLGSGADRDLEVDIELPSGGWRRALMSVRTLLRSTGEVSGAITCVLDVTDSARARHELEQRATFDDLTEVHNRVSILHTLERELEHEDSKQTGVLYPDLDKFKPVNDTLGHAAGTSCWPWSPSVCGSRAGKRCDRPARRGRVPDRPARAAGSEVAMQVAERFSMALCGNFELSCGEADHREHRRRCGRAGSVSADELVKQADMAMYRPRAPATRRPVLAALA